MTPADKDELADILIKVGEIGLKRTGSKRSTSNPFHLAGGRPVAVDGLVTLNAHSS